MNLWVRTLGQLAVLTVALFFFSCEDENSILGFKNPNKKFKVNYVDIPLQSDVFLLDSVRTSNFFGTQGESIRLLAGQYGDDQFGKVKSTAITQFFTTNTAKTLLKETAVFDSVSIQLRFDFYIYGTHTATPQTISVHELERELNFDSASYYFNKSSASYDPSPLGTKTFTISPDDFQTYLDDQKDTTISVAFPLEPSFGQRIFDSAVKYRDGSAAADSTFARLRDFVKEFKGIAVVSEEGDKIFGINPSATASRIVLHYHDADTDSLELNLSFSGVLGYNQVDADRSSSELAGLTQYSEPFLPGESKRYVQSGTGILTRLDFQKFYDFVDADSNSTVVVNSAEVYLGPAEANSELTPIKNLSLRAVASEGYMKRVANKADSTSIALYAGKMGIATGHMVAPFEASNNLFTVSQRESNDFYNGFLTLFVQELFKRDQEKERFRYFALYPENPQIGKSVNRLIFHAENIKLRIFYTRPSEPIQ